MSWLDTIKAAVGISSKVVGSTAGTLANTAVSIPGSVIDKSLSTVPAVVAVPGKIIEEVAAPVLQVLTPQQAAPTVTIEPIEAPEVTKLKIPGYDEGSDKTTAEELMELLPMAGLGLLAFLL